MINGTHEHKDAENSLTVVLNVASQVPPFLTVILEVVARAVCAPLKYSWFLADILRITSEHACSLLPYYMSSACPATSAVRVAMHIKSLFCNESFAPSVGMQDCSRYFAQTFVPVPSGVPFGARVGHD
jgi:hypothetical protein